MHKSAVPCNIGACKASQYQSFMTRVRAKSKTQSMTASLHSSAVSELELEKHYFLFATTARPPVDCSKLLLAMVNEVCTSNLGIQ
eukprot:6211876-Pleurochrysis_carterae.AAC.5